MFQRICRSSRIISPISCKTASKRYVLFHQELNDAQWRGCFAINQKSPQTAEIRKFNLATIIYLPDSRPFNFLISFNPRKTEAFSHPTPYHKNVDFASCSLNCRDGFPINPKKGHVVDHVLGGCAWSRSVTGEDSALFCPSQHPDQRSGAAMFGRLVLISLSVKFVLHAPDECKARGKFGSQRPYFLTG